MMPKKLWILLIITMPCHFLTTMADDGDSDMDSLFGEDDWQPLLLSSSDATTPLSSSSSESDLGVLLVGSVHNTQVTWQNIGVNQHLSDGPYAPSGHSSLVFPEKPPHLYLPSPSTPDSEPDMSTHHVHDGMMRKILIL